MAARPIPSDRPAIGACAQVAIYCATQLAVSRQEWTRLPVRKQTLAIGASHTPALAMVTDTYGVRR